MNLKARRESEAMEEVEMKGINVMRKQRPWCCPCVYHLRWLVGKKHPKTMVALRKRASDGGLDIM